MITVGRRDLYMNNEYSEPIHMTKLIQIVVCDEKPLNYVKRRAVSKNEKEERGKIFPMTCWCYEDT